MNLFGVGPAELIVILVVALVFVGPERLPKLAADIARTIREIRKYTGAIAAEFNEVIQDFEKETAGDRSEWKEIGQGLTEASRSVTEAIRGAHADASAALTPPPATPAQSTTPNGAAQPAAEWRDIADPAPSPGAPEPHANGATPSPEPAQEPR
jgi:sec-independent protein translocase protein TatB